MSRRPKFRPEITRVKLNPEQAVLQCVCYGNYGGVWTATPKKGNPATYCDETARGTAYTERGVCTDGAGSAGKTYTSGLAGS